MGRSSEHGRQKSGGSDLMQSPVSLWYQLQGLASSTDQILLQAFMGLGLASTCLLMLRVRWEGDFKCFPMAKPPEN